MKKIIRVPYLRLRRDEQLALNGKILSLVKEHFSHDSEAFTSFEHASGVLASIVEDKAFQISLSLVELDRVADEAWYAFRLQLKASLRHPYDRVREAAEKVAEIFSGTPNPTNMNYDEEYGALQTLLSQLGRLGVAIMREALVEPQYQALDLAVTNFLKAEKEKVDVVAKQKRGAAKEAALACYEAWRNLVSYLELEASLKKDESAIQTIERINVALASFKRRNA